MAALVAAIVFVIIAGVFYYKVNPDSADMPHCAFRAMTGYDCPGCGFQRALHAALHGDFGSAWHYNAFAFFAVPAAVGFIIVEAVRGGHPRLNRAVFHPAVITAVLIAVLAWWIGRNFFKS